MIVLGKMNGKAGGFEMEDMLVLVVGVNDDLVLNCM